MVTGSPCIEKPLATTLSARRQSIVNPGIERQPSAPSCVSSERSRTGFTRWPTSSSTCQVKTRSPTPIWGAARPAPGASSMVSVRSSTRRRSSLSKSTTSSARRRSTGSPNSRMGWIATRAV